MKNPVSIFVFAAALIVPASGEDLFCSVGIELSGDITCGEIQGEQKKLIKRAIRKGSLAAGSTLFTPGIDVVQFSWSAGPHALGQHIGETDLLLIAATKDAEENGGNLLRFPSKEVEREWKALDADRREQLTESILSSGLSSTGGIKLTKIYSLTHDEAVGKKRDRVALVIQEDLFGNRLFWVKLINLNTGQFSLLYTTGKPPKAEQGGAGQPAAGGESESGS